MTGTPLITSNGFEVRPIEKRHLPELSEMMGGYLNCFPDDWGLDKPEEIVLYLLHERRDTHICTKDGRVVGCVYLETKKHGLGSIGLFTERHAFRPGDIQSLAPPVLSHFFQKHKLKMIYFVTRAKHRAVIRLATKLGFAGQQVMLNYKQMGGEWTDFILMGLLRENMGGGAAYARR